MYSPIRDRRKLSPHMDRLSGHLRSPSAAMSLNFSAPVVVKTEAQHLDPGKYRYDADFVHDKRKVVLKGYVTDSRKGTICKFGAMTDSRANRHGALKAIMQPDNKWLVPTGPGDYEEVDCTKRPVRFTRPSVPSWSIPKGEAQDAVREKQQARRGGNLGPGSYSLPSPFDMNRTQRLGAERRLLCNITRSKSCAQMSSTC